MPESQPKLYEIPADAERLTCQACGAAMYKVRNPATGNKQPLAVAPSYVYKGATVTTGAYPPSGGAPGQGYSHFLDCADPKRFSRRGARPPGGGA